MARMLSSAQLLEARDAGKRLHPIDRALMLLRLFGNRATDDPMLWPLSVRDRALLDLYRASFGDGVACVADCPACGVALEFDLSADAMLSAADPPPDRETMDIAGWRVTLRPLDSRDLAAAALAPSQRAAAELLAECAVVERLPLHDQAPSETMPAELAAAVMARVDAREDVDIRLALSCADCGHGWTAPFDPVNHLWTEIERRADLLIGQVAALASRFGWSEDAILALTPARRNAYLEAVGAS